MNKIDFVGLGVVRTGTTSLWKALSYNDNIVFPSLRISGVDYGLHYPDNGKDGRFFFELWGNTGDTSRFIEAYDSTGTLGDFTGTYICSNSTLDRIASYNSNMKIIYMVRNPLERMYNEMLARRSFQNMKDNISNNQYNYPNIDGPTDCTAGMTIDDIYIDFVIYNSFYGDHYSRLLARFPESNIYVIDLETFSSNQQSTIDSICSFLGVSSVTLPQEYHEHVNIYSATYNEYKIWMDSQNTLKTMLQSEMTTFYTQTGIDYRDIVS